PRLDESYPTGRADAAEHRKVREYRIAATGHHDTPFRVGVDGSDPNLVPIGLKLIGDDASERGANMLPHLGADDVDGHHPVSVDAVPDTRFKRARRWRWHRVRPRFHRSEAEGYAGSGHPDQEGATR